MSKDPRDEALDKIQEIVNFIGAGYELPPEVEEYLDKIEALTRHRDSSLVDTKDFERRAMSEN